MTLREELERIAGAASAHGDVAGVLAAEPSRGRRYYLVALAAGEEHRWAVLDDEGALSRRREDVREVASIVAMCELVGDLAGGGDLESLRTHLAELRAVERPAGIEEAEEAALALERVVGAPPRVASPSFLDEVGAATLELERALGEDASPFSAALRAQTATIDDFVRDVERGYLVELR